MKVILVPGFWLDASSWDGVVPALEESGHSVEALTLPGLESLDADRSGVTLRDHVDAVIARIDAADEPVVLVGHSGGGSIIAGAADARPDRVAPRDLCRLRADRRGRHHQRRAPRPRWRDPAARLGRVRRIGPDRSRRPTAGRLPSPSDPPAGPRRHRSATCLRRAPLRRADDSDRVVDPSARCSGSS